MARIGESVEDDMDGQDGVGACVYVVVRIKLSVLPRHVTSDSFRCSPLGPT